MLPSGTFRIKSKKTYYRALKTVYITEQVYTQIMSVLGTKKPELGGMLGFTMDQDTIDNYVFDSGAKVNSVEYSPNIEYLQTVLDGEWHKHIFLAGFIHSHPGDFNRLSYADVEYARRIIRAFELDYLFMPIVTSSFEYKSSITGYIVKANGKVEKCNIEVVPGVEKSVENEKENDDVEIDADLLKMIEKGFDDMDRQSSTRANAVIDKNNNGVDISLSQNDTFARISNVLDLNYMSECSVIGIGCGGAKSFYESMARIGVAKFYLMDGDVASYSNIASQNGYISEVGMLKPELIKKRILDINEKADVVCFNFMLNDEIDDEFLEKNIISKIDKRKSVICAFTDDFFAQARISRIALKYNIPFLAGQHHAEGAVSELIFWYPELTKYSLREIAKTRYDYYKNGYKNQVTSVGSPIFNTTRLNALCEKIAWGMLLYAYNPNHIYCSFLHFKSDRNLVLIKQRYLNEEENFYGFFDNSADGCFDEVSWINPEAIEELQNVELEEGTVGDTRNIFEK